MSGFMLNGTGITLHNLLKADYMETFEDIQEENVSQAILKDVQGSQEVGKDCFHDVKVTLPPPV